MWHSRSIKLPHVDKLLFFALILCSFLMSDLKPAYSQDARFNRSYGNGMLKGIKSDIKKYYFDKSFGGHDLDASLKRPKIKLPRQKVFSQILAIIAQCLVEFDDSHTYFLPPSRPLTEYGRKIGIVGDKCFVVAVKPGSDADQQGVKPGDEVLKLDGFRPTRDILWKMIYSYYQINPHAQVQFVLKSPDGNPGR